MKKKVEYIVSAHRDFYDLAIAFNNNTEILEELVKEVEKLKKQNKEVSE